MRTCFYFLVLLLALWAESGWGQTSSFQAAVVKKDITPETPQMLLGYGPRKSTGVHDQIYHRIVVMDDGNSRFYLVSSDICLVSPSEYDRVAKILNEKYKIQRHEFWWSVTHTHSAPEVDRKSTRLNSSHVKISYAVFCLKKKKKKDKNKARNQYKSKYYKKQQLMYLQDHQILDK